MKKAIKVFSIIGIVFMGIAMVGSAGDMDGFGYIMIVVMAWMPLCILSLIKQ